VSDPSTNRISAFERGRLVGCEERVVAVDYDSFFEQLDTLPVDEWPAAFERTEQAAVLVRHITATIDPPTEPQSPDPQSPDPAPPTSAT
jgi:hypothetical protein